METGATKGARIDLLPGEIDVDATKSRGSRQRGRYPEAPGFKGDPAGPGADGAAYYSSQLGRRRTQVMRGLEKGPGTAEQIGERVGLHWYLTRPRLSELKALGLGIETGERGPSALGGRATEYRLTTPEERALFLARTATEAEKRGEP